MYIRLSINEHTMSRRESNAHVVAAGHHVQGMPLLSPSGVMNMLSPLLISTECQWCQR